MCHLETPQISFHSFHHIYFISLPSNFISHTYSKFWFSKILFSHSILQNFPTPSLSSAKPRPSRKHKPSKENDPPSDPNLVVASPAKFKSLLSLRPPSFNTLKRKLATVVDALTDNSLPAPFNSGVKVGFSYYGFWLISFKCLLYNSNFSLLAFVIGYCEDEAALSW